MFITNVLHAFVGDMFGEADVNTEEVVADPGDDVQHAVGADCVEFQDDDIL